MSVSCAPRFRSRIDNCHNTGDRIFENPGPNRSTKHWRPAQCQPRVFLALLAPTQSSASLRLFLRATCGSGSIFRTTKGFERRLSTALERGESAIGAVTSPPTTRRYATLLAGQLLVGLARFSAGGI